MCAETSLIGMPIESTADISHNVNFGLIKRPSIKLKLEKHVTAVKVEGIGTATIDMYEDKTDLFKTNDDTNDDINVDGSITLKAQPTHKEANQMGKWTFETDEKTFGSRRVYITYTYRIRNIGEDEYIGKALNEAKVEGKIPYANIAGTVKGEYYDPDSEYILGTYLGKWYYTGIYDNNTEDNTEDDDVKVTEKAFIFNIEDYMSTTNGLQIAEGSDLAQVTTPEGELKVESKNVWKYKADGSGDPTPTEAVKVLQSAALDLTKLAGKDYIDLSLTVYKDSLDTTKPTDNIYRSYAAQLVYGNSGTNITSEAGTLIAGSKKLETVQSYVDNTETVRITDIVPQDDEFIAETILFTKKTGDDKFTPVVLIASITAGLAVVAVGIILVKKFVIK